MNHADYLNLVWPLAFLLLGLIIFRQIGNEVSPIFKSVVGGLSQDASTNAKQYAIALGFGLSASFSSFWDVFSRLDGTSLTVMSWHQYAALWTKVLNPFIVAVLAYATQSDFKSTRGEPKTAPSISTTNTP